MRKNAIIFLFFIILFSSCKTGQKAQAAGKTGGGKKKDMAAARLDKEDQSKLERLFLDAEKDKIIEDWDNAIKNYEDVLSVAPNNADAHFQLGQIYVALSKPAEAEQEVLTAVKLDPRNKWYLELLASIYMDQNRSKDAEETFKTLIDKFPGSPDYYLNLGYLYSRTGQYEPAIKIYDQYEKNFGLDENVIEEKKNLYLHLNKFNDAVNEVQKLVDAFPGETQYLLMEAQLYHANKMDSKAEEIYKKVLSIEPDNADALLHMAEIGIKGGNEAGNEEDLKKIFANRNVDVNTKINFLLPYLQLWDIKKGDKQQAFDLAGILVKTHPDNAKAFTVQGDLYFLDGQYDTALNAYLKSLSLGKNDFQVWQQVMSIYNNKRDWTKLEKTCDEAMDLFPNQALIYLFKGGAEFQNKEYEQAEKSYLKGEKMSADDDKKRAQFFANLGDVYHSLNKFDASDSAYDKALKLDPENAYVLNNYSYYLSLRKVNLEKAKEMSAYSNKLDADNSSFLDTYAWILFQMGDFSGAKEWQEKAMKADGGKSGTILEHYGDILYKLGDKDGALNYWKKAKESGTDSGTIDKKIAEEKYVE